MRGEGYAYSMFVAAWLLFCWALMGCAAGFKTKCRLVSTESQIIPVRVCNFGDGRVLIERVRY